MLTNDKNGTILRAKVLRSWGRMSLLIQDWKNIKKIEYKTNGFDYDRKFVFSEPRYNFEPSEIGASFGIEQLKSLSTLLS